MKNATQCAFPTGAEGDPGLTKREYFAAMAMQGMLSSPSYLSAATKVAIEDSITAVESLSQAAVQHADGLLIELAK